MVEGEYVAPVEWAETSELMQLDRNHVELILEWACCVRVTYMGLTRMRVERRPSKVAHRDWSRQERSESLRKVVGSMKDFLLPFFASTFKTFMLAFQNFLPNFQNKSANTKISSQTFDKSQLKFQPFAYFS